MPAHRTPAGDTHLHAALLVEDPELFERRARGEESTEEGKRTLTTALPDEADAPEILQAAVELERATDDRTRSAQAARLTALRRKRYAGIRAEPGQPG